MIFGAVPIGEALGAVCVHSVRMAEGVVKKGTVLGEAEIARLRAGGVSEVVTARLEPGDVPEDEAARRLAHAVSGAGVRVERPFTGRSNLYAEAAGVLVIDVPAVDAINAVDESITIATLPAWKAVQQGEMIGTVKIIPFAVPAALLDRAVAAGRAGVIRVAAFAPLKVGVVSTLLPGLKGSVIRKTVGALQDRLNLARATVDVDLQSPHETKALAETIAGVASGPSDLVVVFGASAITDRRDVIPAAIEAAGGVVKHFGMPVDPGNLLLVGELQGKPVIGAPGCARSPKENGFDWVLQRLLAGLPVGRQEIASLGVGGLLMEIVQRGQLRDAGPHESD